MHLAQRKQKNDNFNYFLSQDQEAMVLVLPHFSCEIFINKIIMMLVVHLLEICGQELYLRATTQKEEIQNLREQISIACVKVLTFLYTPLVASILIIIWSMLLYISNIRRNVFVCMVSGVAVVKREVYIGEEIRRVKDGLSSS